MSLSLSLLAVLSSAVLSSAALAQDTGSEAASTAPPAPTAGSSEAAQMEETYDPSSPELGRAMRPLTYPANPRLSQGKITNFYKLYVDPAAMPTTLQPRPTERPEAFQRPASEGGDASAAPAEPSMTSSASSTLPIANRTTGWLEVTVGDTKVGVIGPLTTGAIHGVKPGEYDVSFTSSTGYTERARIRTTDAAPEVLVPGNSAATVAGDDGYAPPGYGAFQPTQVPAVRGYVLPAPPTAAPAPAPIPERAPEKTPR